MKKTKLLAPLLGLSAVATVVAPIATSCGSTEVKHVNTTPLVEKSTNSDGVAQFFFLLDSYDYDVNGFTITSSVVSTSNAFKDADFETTFQVQGNKLIVDVKYVGEELDETTSVKLNVNIKYGSMWTATQQVKMNIIVDKGIEMYYEGDFFILATDTMEFKKGKTITLIADMSKVPAGIYLPGWFQFRGWISDEQKATFSTITIYNNDTKLTPEQDYWLYQEDGRPYGFGFTSDYYNQLKTNDVITFVCEGLNGTVNAYVASGYEGDQ